MYEKFVKYFPMVFVAIVLIFTIGIGYLGKRCFFGGSKVRREEKKSEKKKNLINDIVA